MKQTGPYEDILHLPHHVSSRRPQMPMADRAAQFSPFSALTGYEEVIEETGRFTEERPVLGEEDIQLLNRRFQLLLKREKNPVPVTITYFLADKTKAGGTYMTASGFIEKIDILNRVITMSQGIHIPMDDILALEGELFE